MDIIGTIRDHRCVLKEPIDIATINEGSFLQQLASIVQVLGPFCRNTHFEPPHIRTSIQRLAGKIPLFDRVPIDQGDTIDRKGGGQWQEATAGGTKPDDHKMMIARLRTLHAES